MSAFNNSALHAASGDTTALRIAVRAVPCPERLHFVISPGSVSTTRLDPGLGSGATPSNVVYTGRLTPRELQILRLIAKGLHNREIASRLHRSIKTVEKHRQSLHCKLSTHEVAGLTRHAVSMGLAERSPWALRRLDRRARTLTSRELEILRLVAQGSGNKWIASELHRSIKTIDHHRENIMKKLKVHEVAGLTSYAASIGLI
jgi:DNA-binding NarL/FixJ family response regulator